jgi:plasmid stabilization system protein ParE
VKALIWTDAARADLDQMISYFDKSDPRIGAMLLERIEAAAKGLTRFDIGRPGRIAGTREKSVAKTSHVLVYEVHPNEVVVFRVVHTSREWP